MYAFMEEPDFKKSQREASIKASAFCRAERGTAFSFICTWVCVVKQLMFVLSWIPAEGISNLMTLLASHMNTNLLSL